jgi:transposase
VIIKPRVGISLSNWVSRDTGLVAGPVSGRPSKLTPTQEKIALRWLTDSPTRHGFDTELWTAARLGQLIREEFAVGLNPRYLGAWLRDRGFSPQKPQRVARERDPKAIAAWLESDWPRIKKSLALARWCATRGGIRKMGRVLSG